MTGWPDSRWKPLLVAVAVANVLAAPASWIDEGVTPSWIVYPVAVLVGLWRLRAGGTKGTLFLGLAAVVFLVVHLPWSFAFLFDGENPLDADREYSPVQWFVTLLILPLLLAFVAWLARQDARRTTTADSPSIR